MKLVLSTGSTLADESQVVDFLRYAVARGIDLNNLWVAFQGDRLVWATLPIVSPGRTMLLLMPESAMGAPEDIPATLAAQVCGHFQSRGTRLAQAIVDPSAPVAATLCQGAGFVRLAELVYLQADIHRAAPPTAADIQWECYSNQTHAAFADTILATYEQSLDCPLLTGMRDIQDILAGHKNAGEFRPDLWVLARNGQGQALGVLLMAVLPPGHSMELVYLGVCPSARGQGVGKSLFHKAIALAQLNEVPRITLAVDSHNAPALRLYFGQGMRRICTKLALLRDLRTVPATNNDPSGGGAREKQNPITSA
jgi:ribosomal protein S18 acetylase RimI-like enzyme